MHYVVMDLEWNQAMSSKSSVFNKLPIHLRGEIIEIGAVKLNEDMTPAKNSRSTSSPFILSVCTTRSKSSPASTASVWPPV